MKYTHYLLFALLLAATTTFSGEYASSVGSDSLEGQQAKAAPDRVEHSAVPDENERRPSWKLVRSAADCLKAGEAGAPAADPEIVPAALDQDTRTSRSDAAKTVGAYLARSPGRQTFCRR